MQAAHRMHLSDGQNFFMPKREERPLSTRIMCISPFCRGVRKCDVYWVMELPVALRVSRRMKTARSSFLGMIFSSPTEQIRSSGTLPERSALPSLVTVTMAPVSATAKLAPVIPALALFISGRVFSRITCAR
jgi:hypothetical protein